MSRSGLEFGVVCGGQCGGFERANHGGADGDDASGTASGGVDGRGGLGSDGIALAVELDFAHALDAQRSERAEADVERDACDLDSLG